MRLRVVQWNTSGTSGTDAVGFIREAVGQGPAVVCLEEVKIGPRKYQWLTRELQATSACFSLDWRKRGPNEGDERASGVAVFGFGLPMVFWQLLDRSLFPERTLSVLLSGDFGPIRVVAFHSLTGVRYVEAKASNFACIADYLQQHKSDLDFLCFDGNEPTSDSMDAEKVIFSPRRRNWVNKAHLIMGPQKVHDLADSYVAYLTKNGQIVTDDPLIKSYVTKKSQEAQGQRSFWRRYDHIMHSPRWEVIHCEYPYEKSVTAGSDHSAVIADYELK